MEKTHKARDRDRGQIRHSRIGKAHYRVMLVVWQLGWVEIDLGYYTTCWAAGVMAEWAEQVGRVVELENLSQHNQLPDYKHHPVMEIFPGICFLSPSECTFFAFLNKMRLPGSTKSSTKKRLTSLVSEKS